MKYLSIFPLLLLCNLHLQCQTLTRSSELTFNWNQVDTPPLFHPLDSTQDQDVDSIARRQLLFGIYRRLRAPRQLSTQNTPANVAAKITFQVNGTLTIDRLMLVNPGASMYTNPDEDDQITARVGGSSHPNYELLDKIQKIPGFRASRAQQIYREALLLVEKSLRGLSTFSPAIKNGEKVKVSRTLFFSMSQDLD